VENSIIPFTSSAWLAGYHARSHKAKNWIHIQDFEFDAAVQSGVSSGGKKFIFKFLFSLEQRILTFPISKNRSPRYRNAFKIIRNDG